jgi:NAD(P)-dependent dehydrogenase (short-subunit alcohol dehydrogenase family)
MNRPLAGRTAIVTGASRGLGLAIARAYVEAGASLVMCARDETVLAAARDAVAALAGPGQTVVAQPADVSREADVAEVLRVAHDAFPQLHVLVNNAGIYGPMGSVETLDWTAWMRAVEINLLGSLLMCRAVLPGFKSAYYGKVVQLSGGGATNPLPGISAYAASKAAVVRLAETVAEECRPYRIDVNAIAPGALNTRLLDEVITSGPDRVGPAFYERSLQQKVEGGAPLERGAALAVFLASGASDGITGKLLSAMWDPWTVLAEHRAELARTDVYTLRRIVPADRGLAWGGAA